MLEVRAAFVFKTVAGTSHARSGGIAALDHEIRNHAMEFEAVVKAAEARFRKEAAVTVSWKRTPSA